MEKDHRRTQRARTVGHLIMRAYHVSHTLLVEDIVRNDHIEHDEIIDNFISVVSDHLKLDKFPTIKLLDDPLEGTFGYFDRDNEMICVVRANRHIVDVLRTLAHELVHWSQHLNDELHDESGETGSDHENEANSVAGVIMRDFSKRFPHYIGK